jgi:hypothetical protein
MTDAIEKEHVCWACSTTRLVVVRSGAREYYICPTCNPDHTIEELIEGCLVKCKICAAPVSYGNDQDITCDYCAAGTCQWCAVSPNDIDDVKGDYCSQECLYLARARHMAQRAIPKRGVRGGPAPL